MRWTIPLFLIGVIIFAGCAKHAPMKAPASRKDAASAPSHAEAKKETPRDEYTSLLEPAGEVQVAAGQIGIPPKAGNPLAKKAKPQRKIRYTAEMRIFVDDFAKAEKELDTAIAEAKGILANSELNSAANAVRSGTWRVRVPVENLHSFRAAVVKIGEVELNKLDTDDLTDRYYDLEAHIKNRNAERDALRDLLREVGKKEIKYYLEIKRELDSVSDDINRKEGQLRLWANLTDLTTCTVHMREKQKYLAEKKIEDKELPTFRMRAGKTWGTSWQALLDFGEGLAILAIALTPWLPVFIVVGAGLWLMVRRLRRKHAAPPVVVTPIEESASKPA